jgi:hypothetical protein
MTAFLSSSNTSTPPAADPSSCECDASRLVRGYLVGDHDLGVRVELQDERLKPIEERFLLRRDRVDVSPNGLVHAPHSSVVGEPVATDARPPTVIVIPQDGDDQRQD